MRYAYRYLIQLQPPVPLRLCPGCRADLGEPDAVEVEFIDDDRRPWSKDGCIDPQTGDLLVEGNDIANGFHSHTMCGVCGELLIDLGCEEVLIDKPIYALLQAVKALNLQMPPADAMCHRGMCLQDDCLNCSRIAAVLAAMAAVEKESS